MKKKKTALMMAAVMTVSLLAACGQKTSAPAAESAAQPDAAQTTEASKEASREESQAPAESTGEVTELKVFGFKTGAEEGAIPTLIEQFNKEILPTQPKLLTQRLSVGCVRQTGC